MSNILINIKDCNLSQALCELLSPYYSLVDHESEADLLIADAEYTGSFEPKIVVSMPINPKKLLHMVDASLSTSPIYKHAEFTFDAFNRSLIVRGGEFLLTEKEADLLSFLLNKKGDPIPKADLLEAVWGYNSQVDSHTLETHIYRLRQKLERDPSTPDILISDKSGYRIRG